MEIKGLDSTWWLNVHNLCAHPSWESSWRLRGSEVLRGRAQGKTRRLLPGKISSLRRDHAQLFHLTPISVQLHQKDSSQPTSKPLPYLSLSLWFIVLAPSDTGMHACAHLSLGTATISLVLLTAVFRSIQQCLSGRHFKLNPNSTCCVSEKGGRDRDGDKVLNEGWETAQRVKVSAAQAWQREFEFLSRNSRWKELTPVFSDVYISCGKCTSILTYAKFLLWYSFYLCLIGLPQAHSLLCQPPDELGLAARVTAYSRHHHLFIKTINHFPCGLWVWILLKSIS